MAKKVQRITVKSVRNDVLEILNLEKGLLYTILEFIKRPLKTVNNYLFEDRSKLFNPFRFIFFSVATYTFLVTKLIGQIDIRALAARENNTLEYIDVTEKLIQQTLGLINLTTLLSIPIFAFFTKTLFDQQKYNYAEHVAINSYIFGFSSWVTCFFLLLGVLLPSDILFLGIASTLFLLTPIIFYKRIFEKSWPITLLFYFIIYLISSTLAGIISFIFSFDLYMKALQG